MTTLKKILWVFSLAAVSACSQTHYVANGLSVQNRGTTDSSTSTATPSYTSYLLANLDRGQLVTSTAAGTFLDYLNIQADPLAEWHPSVSGTTPYWRPVQPGFYIVTASIAFAPPQSSYAPGGGFIPGSWPLNSFVTLSISRNDLVVLHSTTTACSGTVLCQAEVTIAIAMRETSSNQDALAFNAVVSSATTSLSMQQLQKTTGHNPYSQLSIVRVTQN